MAPHSPNRLAEATTTEFVDGVAELGPAGTDPIELELLVNGISRSMERGKKREVAALQRGLSVLATISSSAPFVGLFGTVFGIIASTTQPFCQSCDRSRLTADGMWYLCLYAKAGLDLGEALRGGVSREALGKLIAGSWGRRTDRGAEARLATGTTERSPLIQIGELKRDPHLEMHTRGG